MRKILLGTTAVVGAALLSATVAQAQTPAQLPVLPNAQGVNGAPNIAAQGRDFQVRIGGFLLTSMQWTNDDLDKAKGPPTGIVGNGQNSRQQIDFRNEVEIQVSVAGKAANGLTYGAVVEFQNDNQGSSIVDLDEAWVWISSPTLGTVRFGEEDSAASIMQVRLPTINAMGPDGDWDDGIIGPLSGSTVAGGAPSLITGVNDGNDSTKIIYMSPQFFGFDFGVSYAPNQNEGERMIAGRAVDTLTVTPGGGLFPTSAQRDMVTLTNEVSYAARYRGSFSNVGVQASFVGMRADGIAVASATGLSLAPPGRDVTAYSAGLQVAAFGFSVGGEYTWGNYSGVSVGRASLAPGRDASSHFALGATYTTGPIAVGAYYGQGTQDNGTSLTVTANNASTTIVNPSDRQQTVWGIGATYTLAPGLELFASWNQLQDKNVYITTAASRNVGTTASPVLVPGGVLQNRDAQVLFLGTRLAF
jgi:predicted porin